MKPLPSLLVLAISGLVSPAVVAGHQGEGMGWGEGETRPRDAPVAAGVDRVDGVVNEM
jgi:hypothetical protein